MKKKHIIVALCIAVPLLYFSYRVWNAAKQESEEPELQANTVTVTPGRYFLDDGTQTVYLDISNCDAEAQTFTLTYYNVDIEDLNSYLLNEEYQAITEWDIKCDDTGEPLYDEDGNFIHYTAEECEQLNQENLRQIQESISVWCAEPSHTYGYLEPMEMYLNADWYSEIGKDGNDSGLTSYVIVFSDKIMFEEYTWKLDPSQEEK